MYVDTYDKYIVHFVQHLRISKAGLGSGFGLGSMGYRICANRGPDVDLRPKFSFGTGPHAVGPS